MANEIITILNVLGAGDKTALAAWGTGDGPSSVFFRTDFDGGHQLDFDGTTYSNGWESYTSSVNIYEDGIPLISHDSESVDFYRIESYTEGRFHSNEEVARYLKEKYKGASFEEVMNRVPIKLDQEHMERRYDDPAYEAFSRLSEKEQLGLKRIAIMDKGTVKFNNGETRHVVTPVYACDLKVMGKDEQMPNPYVLANKEKNGKTNHDLYLPAKLYEKLKSCLNTENCEGTRWAGVVEAKIGYITNRNSSGKRASLDLTSEAFKKQWVIAPKEPFNPAAHDSFVKESLRQARVQRGPQLNSERKAAQKAYTRAKS